MMYMLKDDRSFVQNDSVLTLVRSWYAVHTTEVSDKITIIRSAVDASFEMMEVTI